MVKEISSLKKRDELERKANSKLVTQDVTKWQSIIKKNRESDQINFSQKDPLPVFRM